MAEAALFSLASSLLSRLASPSIKKAYERVQSIRGARDELSKLGKTIETIQAVLIDAEKKQEQSAAVKEWIKRTRDVLYEADDLLDEVATNDLLIRQMKGNNFLKKVRVSCSLSNSISSNKSIAKKVKSIRKRLLEISQDMAHFKFVECQYEERVSGMRRGWEQGSFVDPKDVVGRVDDKKTILEFLFDESNDERNLSLIAIVGIAGMGKTTVAQLMYNDDQVKRHFTVRWWVCISDIFDEKEVIGRIFQSITGERHHDLNMSQLESGIRQSISENGKFLLILDDLWDEKHDRGQKLRALLSNVANGSKIIVTARSPLVARAMDADKIHQLDGLAEDESWELFKRLAFPRGQENNENWASLGREIVKKCANVPLAIRSIASLLYTKTTVEEWISFKDDELFKIELSDNPIMVALKLSYDHLKPNLKHCFAYCSLFPKDYRINKEDLIYLWIAQGYVKPNNEKETVEEAGHAYFMELLRRSFLQEAYEDYGEIESCKMHDLVHDLAQLVAGDEITILNTQSIQFCNNVRHVTVGYEINSSWEVPTTLLHESRIRSTLFMGGGSLSALVLDQQLTKFKFLRALDLRELEIGKVPSSVGELKHLRHLNLSGNICKELPNSMTKLLNLLTLDIRQCRQLETLPKDFRKLINLRHLDTNMCVSLRHMPHGFGELTSLQRLSYFKVGKAVGGGKSSGLDVLARLKLRGDLKIEFDDDIDCWNDDELMLEISQLPAMVEMLYLTNYPGMRIPSLPTRLVKLRLSSCSRVKHLPSFKCFPYLNTLVLWDLDELEYIEDDEEKNEGKQDITTATNSSTLFFPCLGILVLNNLRKLKGWSREVEAAIASEGTVQDQQQEIQHSSPTCPTPPHMPSFPLLSTLVIFNCPDLKSMPLSPRLQTARLTAISLELIQQLMPTCSNSSPSTALSSSSSSLEDITIFNCDGLTSFSAEAFTCLRHLEIMHCQKLKKVVLGPSHVNVLEELGLWECPELELWEEDRAGVDWNSLPNLRLLRLDAIPNEDKLPDCLQQRQALGRLRISRRWEE